MYMNEKKTRTSFAFCMVPLFKTFLSFSRERLPFQNQLAFEQTAVIGNPKFERVFSSWRDNSSHLIAQVGELEYCKNVETD